MTFHTVCYVSFSSSLLILNVYYMEIALPIYIAFYVKSDFSHFDYCVVYV